jgi:hypothetical protein
MQQLDTRLRECYNELSHKNSELPHLSWIILMT